MTDTFQDHTPGLESPPSHILNVSPNDNQDMPTSCRALNVATDGLVRVTLVGGTTGTVFIAAGVTFPLRAKRVWATGTTATGIAALS